MDILTYFQERKKAEDQLVADAIARRTVDPTTIPPWCVCPASKRKKRDADEEETTEPSTEDEEDSTDPSETTPKPSTTTWPNTCICPEIDEIDNRFVENVCQKVYFIIYRIFLVLCPTQP